MIPDERYEVRNEEIERYLRTLATLINDEIPEGWAFGLFLVPFGKHEAAPKGAGAVFWISNGDRAGMLDAVKGWIEDNARRAGTPDPLAKLRAAFDAELIAEVGRHGGIPALPRETLALRDAIAEVLQRKAT